MMRYSTFKKPNRLYSKVQVYKKTNNKNCAVMSTERLNGAM